MRLIKNYDILIQIEELKEALQPKHLKDQYTNVLLLFRKAFELGREAEQLERAEETTAKEGGVVKIV